MRLKQVDNTVCSNGYRIVRLKVINALGVKRDEHVRVRHDSIETFDPPPRSSMETTVDRPLHPLYDIAKKLV
nr:hypothetical protein CFP56_12222 [Quercus suber]